MIFGEFWSPGWVRVQSWKYIRVWCSLIFLEILSAFCFIDSLLSPASSASKVTEKYHLQMEKPIGNFSCFHSSAAHLLKYLKMSGLKKKKNPSVL